MERINDCTVNGGCHADCCRDVWFVHSMSKDVVEACFPNPVRIKAVNFDDENLPQGVYYWRSLTGECRVRIVGVCPNLQGTDCGTYNKTRAYDCEAMHRGSDNCVDARRRTQRLMTNP